MARGPRDRRRAKGRHEDERHEPEHAVREDDERRDRLRSGRPCRLADADHVAADVAGQEIIEEQRDEKRSEERTRAHIHVLGVQEDVPSPDTHQHVDEIDRQRGGQPRQRRLARAGPQPADVDLREEQREQDDAHGELDCDKHVVSR